MSARGRFPSVIRRWLAPVAILAIEYAARLASSQDAGDRARISSLIAHLDLGQIEATSALRELSPRDAELVLRLALGCLLPFRDTGLTEGRPM